MASKHPKRTSIGAEEKLDLKRDISLRKSQGQTNHSIALALGCDWGTVKSYWAEIIDEAGEKADPVKLLTTHRIYTQRAMEKTLRDFYADKTDIKSVLVAINLVNDFNGLNKYLSDLNESKPVKDLPPLLRIEVTNVEVEMPPVKDF